MDYAIITNTFNRPIHLVEKSLRSSLNQQLPPKEVILIDQNDPPLKLSPELLSFSNLKIQRTKVKAVSEARNLAKITEDAEWLVFCDDDGYLHPNYSNKLKQMINTNPSIEIIAGAIIREDNFEYYTKRQQLGGNINKFINTKLLMGSNFAVLKDTFNKLGRFDPSFGAGAYWGSGEETDFAWKSYFNKVPMLYCKDLIIFHVKPYAGNLRHSRNKAFKYGVGKGALVGKWLFTKKEIVVTYELIEMLTVPGLKLLLGVLSFNFKVLLTSIESMRGRATGLACYIHLQLRKG